MGRSIGDLVGLWCGVEALEICGVGGSIGDLVELWCGGRHWRCSGVVGGVEALEI